MNLSFFIAKRYFFSGKKKTFITFISIISMAVVGVSTMALIIVLSVFNGLEGLMRNLYGTFDADIVVLPVEGKSFEYADEIRKILAETKGIQSYNEAIEDNVLVKYRGAQRVLKLKGVSDEFLTQGRFASALTLGDMTLKADSIGYAIIGRGIQYNLGVNINDDFHPLQIYYPRDIGPGQINPERMFTLRHILAGSVFAVEKYFDENYMFVPIEFTRDLLGFENRVTSVEIRAMEGEDIYAIKNQLASSLGSDFIIKSNEELHGSLFRILQWEKIFVFLTFGIILAIGSINIFFSLSMLVIDKKKDLAVFKALGASSDLLKKTFLAEGSLIAFTGAFIGLLLGLTISWLQQTFGLISMGVPGAISDAYPVQIKGLDVAITCSLVVIITILASIQPAKKAAKSLDLHLLQ